MADTLEYGVTSIFLKSVTLRVPTKTLKNIVIRKKGTKDIPTSVG